MLTLQYFNRFQMKKLTVTNSTDFFLFSVISSLVLSLLYLPDQTWGRPSVFGSEAMATKMS